jgi:hypothetical protein
MNLSGHLITFALALHFGVFDSAKEDDHTTTIPTPKLKRIVAVTAPFQTNPSPPCG